MNGSSELLTGRILQGDALEVLKSLPDESVQTCVTSPPYWGLRDYGADGQIGLEQTPEEYTAKLVEVFREVRRVLRKDGTLWLNLGDSYASNGCYLHSWMKRHPDKKHLHTANSERYKDTPAFRGGEYAIKAKDLVGIPWRVAFALQTDGWYLRQDIIWAKPNPMPESVTDRCTKAHEYIFLLAKSQRYYYDAEAIKEPAVSDGPRGGNPLNDTEKGPNGGKERWKGERALDWAETGRNRRSVWQIATMPYSGAHFATFPEELIEPCILAGAPEGGVVLDPFFGSGTTGAVAARLGRKWLGIELNPAYIDLAKARVSPHDMMPLIAVCDREDKDERFF